VQHVFKLFNLSSDKPLRPRSGTLVNMHADHMVSKISIGCGDKQGAEEWLRAIHSCIMANKTTDDQQSVTPEDSDSAALLSDTTV
jgi:hypothetical protein